jgi:hypothetical protein
MALKSICLHLVIITVFSFQSFAQLKPGDPDWPVVWMSYGSPVKSIEEDLQDMLDHGVQCVSMSTKNEEDARYKLQLARKLGLKYDIRVGSHLTVNVDDIEKAGLVPEQAIMLGGVYKGKAIDRHVYTFDPDVQKIVIEKVSLCHIQYTLDRCMGAWRKYKYPSHSKNKIRRLPG